MAAAASNRSFWQTDLQGFAARGFGIHDDVSQSRPWIQTAHSRPLILPEENANRPGRNVSWTRRYRAGFQ